MVTPITVELPASIPVQALVDLASKYDCKLVYKRQRDNRRFMSVQPDVIRLPAPSAANDH